MKITALITTLVLGTSTVAMASPSSRTTVSASGSVSVGGSVHWGSTPQNQPGRPAYIPPAPAPTVVVRDHRHQPARPRIPSRPVTYYQPAVYQPSSYEPVYQQPVYQPSWEMVGANMSFAHTDGSRRAEIGTDRGLISQVRITGNTGTPYIMMVEAVFEDGNVQIWNGVAETLSRGESVDLKLDTPRRLLRVIVMTHDNGQLVDHDTGTFNVSVL